MPKVRDVNKYLMDKEKRDAMINRSVIESSIFEDIYNVDLFAPYAIITFDNSEDS